MSQTADMSILALIFAASPLVQFIMLLLLLASIWSWSIIFSKLYDFRTYRAAALNFEERFSIGADLNNLYKSIQSEETKPFGMERIFATGFREFVRLKNLNLDRNSVLDGTNRAMRVVMNRETDKLETWLPFLATVGSTSPYIGLFGTVWGIMNSFRALGQASNATLAMVAPGISEALIATAMGLFAAIPGVIFYNRFATETERLVNKYETFAEEFSTILQHQSLGSTNAS